MNAQTIAANWAAKEAFSKAMGTGIRGFGLNEVSVLRNEAGAPYFLLTGNAKILADQRGFSFSVSLSHTAELALAFVIAYDCKQG
jgi:holo-[acyl-carrier protein] synthase